MTFLLIICWDEQTIRNGEAMPERHFILPEGASGEGISKGNIIFVRRDADSFSYTAKAVIPL